MAEIVVRLEAKLAEADRQALLAKIRAEIPALVRQIMAEDRVIVEDPEPEGEGG